MDVSENEVVGAPGWMNRLNHSISSGTGCLLPLQQNSAARSAAVLLSPRPGHQLHMSAALSTAEQQQQQRHAL